VINQQNNGALNRHNWKLDTLALNLVDIRKNLDYDDNALLV
jgi:hypothetical protein